MRPLILSIALLAGPALAGDMVARQDGDTVRLTEAPCPDEVLQYVAEGSRGYFRKALAIIDGRNFVACHYLRPDDRVLVVYEDGDQRLIPLAHFKPDPGV